MSITSLRILDFRNLAAAEISPCVQGLNIICGDNGSGKTSLLEAIYYLGLGRSFRSSTATRMIKHESLKFSLFAQLISENERLIPIGAERDVHGISRSRLAEQDVTSIAELASLLPILIINSQSHQLFEAGPIFRRKYLDWGLFYHFKQFLPCWRQFERVLKQRNVILRDKRPRNELEPWTAELIKLALELDRYRHQYIHELTAIISELAAELLNLPPIELSYDSGWPKDADLNALFVSKWADEYRFGYTLYGPHRADLEVKIQQVPAKYFLSRGQQKLLICAMILAQGMLLAKHANKGLIYLIDDLPAELDLHSRQKLISLLSRQPTQIFITAVDAGTICDLTTISNVPMKVFHVEHGSVVTVTEI
jgi:DNA replication and repair protein RecF